ncbi:unnamed protein product, partial [Iphiclides podalirius]
MQQIVNNEEIENLDLTKIAALQQKRTLAFVNHFIITTVQFLNTFSKTCENKLKQFEEKLEKVDAAMILLEARLSSIPEVNDVSKTDVKEEICDSSQEKPEDLEECSVNETILNTEDKKQDTEGSDVNHTIQAKPEYYRFIKMIQVGVPLGAVKLKVSLEGLDPKQLDSLLKK